MLTPQTLHIDTLHFRLAQLLNDVIQLCWFLNLENLTRNRVEYVVLLRTCGILDQVRASAVIVIEQGFDDAVGILFDPGHGPEEFVFAVFEPLRAVAPMWSGRKFHLSQVSVLLSWSTGWTHLRGCHGESRLCHRFEGRAVSRDQRAGNAGSDGEVLAAEGSWNDATEHDRVIGVGPDANCTGCRTEFSGG